MRDIVLALFIAGLLPMIVARPYLGALAWAWISMMNPHTLTYGFARGVPWAMVIAIATLLGFLFTKDKKSLPLNGGTLLIGLLMFWMSVTSLYALNPDTGEVLDRWVFAFKVLFMLCVTFMLLRGRQQIEWLIWTMVISVGFYGAKGGLWTVLTGGGGRVWGPPGGTLAGNNELAIGLIILLPWMYYLRQVSKNQWSRRATTVAMLLVAFGILGSQSRGALLAVLAVTVTLGWKSKNFIRTSLALLVVGSAAIAFMPESWTSRMDTINTYQADTSAMSRIWTWHTLFNVAVDRPLVGAGFRADNLAVFSTYAPFDGYEIVQGTVYVAHSIYFQALGEHGFVGLGLYLLLGAWTWFAAGRLARTTQNDPELGDWVPLLMRMTQASLVGFAVGGAFLSMMLTDLTYYIPGVVILVHATVAEHRKRAAARAVAAPPMAPSEGARSHVLPGRSSA